MTANVHERTGIAYGVIAASHVPGLYDYITSKGVDTTQQAFDEEIKSTIESELSDFDADEFKKTVPTSTTVLEAYEDHWFDFAFKKVDISRSDARKFAQRVLSLTDHDSLTFDIEEVTEDLISFLGENNCFDGDGGEHDYEYDDGDAKYLLSYLGGAALIWVIESKFITYCRQCSPCVPNAGDLDNPTTEAGANTIAYCLDPLDYDDDADEDCIPAVIRSVDKDGTPGDIVFEKNDGEDHG